MIKARLVVYASLALIGAVLLCAVFWDANAQSERTDAPPIRVFAQRVVALPGTTIPTGYAGIINARRTSALGFERGGLVVNMSADLGQIVQKGQVLAQLDTRAQNADLLAARANVLQVEAQRKIAESTMKRQQALLEKGHISAQRLEEISANLVAAAAAKGVAQAQVKTLQARLALSKIIAPYDGIIAERYIDEGSIASPGSPVFSLIENHVLEIRIGLPAERAADLTIGEVFDFSTVGQTFQARLRGFSGTVDRATQTVSAAFDLVVPEAALVPGQTARLELSVSLDQSGFWVPLGALREDRRGLWSLFALDESPQQSGTYTLSPRLVEVLYAGADRVYVRGPIEEDTLILSGGNHTVASGMRVVPIIAANTGQP